MDSRLSILAHNMRTPLTVLKLSFSLLASANSSVNGSSLVATVEENLARLEQIADQLDKLAKEGSG